jgi:murein L,D-transpeptidase YafK
MSENKCVVMCLACMALWKVWMHRSFAGLSIIGVFALLLSGCVSSTLDIDSKSTQAIPAKVKGEMAKKQMRADGAVLVRIFKQESELEVWKRTPTGRFALLKTYPICRWSGDLGPKKKTGDRRAPEGFYMVNASQLNPKSRYYLSFNLGFPNRLDAAYGYTGDALMVHGACSSQGCYAMTDEAMAEIYPVVRDALKGGQPGFQVQAFPFRMTPQNMAANQSHPDFAFWKNIKEGYDIFEVTKRQPQVSYCGGKYVFNTQFEDGDPTNPLAACPAAVKTVDPLVASRSTADEQAFSAALATSSVMSMQAYADGGMHPSFRKLLKSKGPEALAKQTSSTEVPISKPDAALADPYQN